MPKTKWMRTWRDLLFPPICLSCGKVCEQESKLRHVCERCEPLIVRVKKPHCESCGHPFFGEVEGERICPHCDGLAPAYSRAKTITLFKGPARELLLELKYRRGTFVLEDIKTLIGANSDVLDFVRGAKLVPVPLHPRKEREREYNQSRLLAEIFVELLGEESEVVELLDRTIDSESQTAYDRATRRQRMKNAFAPRSGTAITASDRYVLVDDVFTTGSTLNACALALRRAGCLNLDVITFAHG